MMSTEADERDGRKATDDAPMTPVPADDGEELRERCKTDRKSLSPRETADCAGKDLAELYENEEDGGS